MRRTTTWPQSSSWEKVQASDPRMFAFDAESRLCAGMEDGRIIRFALDGTNPELFADTGGRPLGMTLDANGALIVADAFKGLLSITREGAITVLTNEVHGQPIRFADDLDIAADGTVFFSDASTRFSIDNYMLDVFEHRPSGRLLRFDPSSGSTAAVSEEGNLALAGVAEGGSFWIRSCSGFGYEWKGPPQPPDPTGEAYAQITSATEHGGMLYFGSIGEDAIGRLPVP